MFDQMPDRIVGDDARRTRDGDIDLDRVVWDPDYRRKVLDALNRRSRVRTPDRQERAPVAPKRERETPTVG